MLNYTRRGKLRNHLVARLVDTASLLSMRAGKEYYGICFFLIHTYTRQSIMYSVLSQQDHQMTERTSGCCFEVVSSKLGQVRPSPWRFVSLLLVSYSTRVGGVWGINLSFPFLLSRVRESPKNSSSVQQQKFQLKVICNHPSDMRLR